MHMQNIYWDNLDCSDSPDKIPVWKPASESQLPLLNRIGNSLSGTKDK